MNAIVFGWNKGRGQKSSPCSEDISVMEFYLPVLSFHLLWSILFIFCVLASEGRNAMVLGRDKGEKSEVFYLLERYIIQKRKMIYCHNIVVNLSYTMIAGDIILSALTASRRQYQNKPQPSVPFPISLLKDYCIHSFWSQNTEKRNHTISQMRLRSVFKMRMSILNAATTEQMGYGIVSFFVYFLQMNQFNVSFILPVRYPVKSIVT